MRESLLDIDEQTVIPRGAVVRCVGDPGEGRERPQQLRASNICREQGCSGELRQTGERIGDLLAEIVNRGLIARRAGRQVAVRHRVDLSGSCELRPAVSGSETRTFPVTAKTLASTGNPIFNAPWTYLGNPCVNVQILEADGLPMGVQLIGARRDDGRLLRTAKWLSERYAD